MFTDPPDCVYVTKAFVLVRRPATFVVPPSKVKDAPMPAPTAFAPTVPRLRVPAVTRREPLFVGEPFCPTTVAFASFSQKPPVPGIAYAASVKIGLEKADDPEILNVPFVIVRNPAVFEPRTVIAPPGWTSSVEAALVPLFRVMPLVDRRSSVPVLMSEASAAPVKVTPAPAVLEFVLKSIAPALTRL